jgi:hypothetical protein
MNAEPIGVGVTAALQAATSVTDSAFNVWLAANTLALLVIAWRGGERLGSIGNALDEISKDLTRLLDTRDTHIKDIAYLDGRMNALEGRLDRLTPDGP